MLFLQGSTATEGMQIGGLVLSLANTALLAKMVFGAGQYTQKVDDHDRRIENLESNNGCLAEDCPVRKG